MRSAHWCPPTSGQPAAATPNQPPAGGVVEKDFAKRAREFWMPPPPGSGLTETKPTGPQRKGISTGAVVAVHQHLRWVNGQKENNSDLSSLENCERNSAKPKARKGRASGSERVHELQRGDGGFWCPCASTFSVDELMEPVSQSRRSPPIRADANLGLRELHPVGKGFFRTGKAYFLVGKRRFLIGKSLFPVRHRPFPVRPTNFPVGKQPFPVGNSFFRNGKRPFPVWNAYFPIRKTGPLSSFLMKITRKPQKMPRAIPGTVTTAGRKPGPRTSNA